MAERTDQRTRSDETELLDDTGVDSTIEPNVDTERESTMETETKSGGLRDRVPTPAGGLFDLRLFLVVLVLSMVATVGAGAILPLGGLAGFLGIALIGFGVGLADDTPRYIELLVAGALAAGLGTLLDRLVLTLVGVGLPLIAVGVGAGSLAGVLGHYFGRDLRDGLSFED
jgi:hypothetical protein